MERPDARGPSGRWLAAAAICISLVTALTVATTVNDKGAARVVQSGGIHKIRHVVMIMQENRSFDHYFGTFPGADGIEMRNGVPTACLPDPGLGRCVRPYPDHRDRNYGGPHAKKNHIASINGGKMDGFIKQLEPSDTPWPDVMGYHTRSDIPNYWTYAEQFVLQDRMFVPTTAWSLPSHLFAVSGWSAVCRRRNDPDSCTNALQQPGRPPDFLPPKSGARRPDPIYAWTDLTYLLHKNEVSWGYYIVSGTEPDCRDDAAMSCAPIQQDAKTPGVWNPLPYFDTVRNNGQLDNIQSVEKFYAAAKAGKLPAVSWVVPSGTVSEHPPASVSAGQSYVTSLVNAVMRSPDWSSTAIFIAWDDWGGFYDHVQPPRVDENGYGLRVPGLVISPYAKRGYIDHQTLSFDAYLKFIEDIFLDGQRLDPMNDGRPDPRPVVRENVAMLGDLRAAFDFEQPPRPPLVLPVRPKTTLTDSRGRRSDNAAKP